MHLANKLYFYKFFNFQEIVFTPILIGIDRPHNKPLTKFKFYETLQIKKNSKLILTPHYCVFITYESIENKFFLTRRVQFL